MSGEKNAGRTHDIKNDNSSIQREEEFKDLVETLKNQNFIQEEITSKLNSGNACYHSVQNLLSSSLLSKNWKIKIYRTKICLVFCAGVKLGHSHWGCLKIGFDGTYLGLRGTWEQGSGENYIMRSLMICTPCQNYSCHKIENEMGRACSMYGGEEMFIQGLSGDTWGKETNWKTQA